LGLELRVTRSLAHGAHLIVQCLSGQRLIASSIPSRSRLANGRRRASATSGSADDECCEEEMADWYIHSLVPMTLVSRKHSMVSGLI